MIRLGTKNTYQTMILIMIPIMFCPTKNLLCLFEKSNFLICKIFEWKNKFCAIWKFSDCPEVNRISLSVTKFLWHERDIWAEKKKMARREKADCEKIEKRENGRKGSLGVVQKWRHTLLDDFSPPPPVLRLSVLRL